jgi:ATP-grasp domain, R2K clade family 3
MYGMETAFDTRVLSVLDAVSHFVPSPFFSVDIAQRTDGRFRVVEIGDGQVSDLVGWTEQRFAEIWK